MKYMFVLLVLAVVVIPLVSVIRRAKFLKGRDIDLDSRIKELKELADKSKLNKEDK